MKKTMNNYRKGILTNINLIEEFNKKHISFKNYVMTLNKYSLEITNIKTYKVINIPLIIKCTYDGTDYSFYEFVTGEEYHRDNSRSTLLKGEKGNIVLILSDTPAYNNNLLVSLLEEMDDEEKTAYIYGMEQLPVISKNMELCKKNNFKKDIQKETEEYLDSFVKKFKQN